MAMTKDRAAMIRDWLRDFAALASKNTDEVGWIMLKLSCSRLKAARTIEQAKRVLGDTWGR